MITKLSGRFQFVALTALGVFCGCGGEGYQTAEVTGRVTLDGQPVEAARVAFEPIAPAGTINAGPGSYGTTDADGVYMLTTIDGSRGAVVGKHRVTIGTQVLPPPGETGETIPERVPQRYVDGSEQLQFTVPPDGTDTANFALISQ